MFEGRTEQFAPRAYSRTSLCAFQQGDEAAFEELYREHRAEISMYHRWRFKRCSPEDADDLTEDTFIRVWLKRDLFDPSRDFRIWLYRVARNIKIDFLRARRRCPLEPPYETTGRNNILSLSALSRDLDNEITLQECLDHLSDQQREVIILIYGRGFTNSQVAEILQCRVGTVDACKYKALEKLRASYTLPVAQLRLRKVEE